MFFIQNIFVFIQKSLLTSNFAGIAFNSSIHLTSWKPTNEKSDLFIEEYLNSTIAFSDRRKYMFLPHRVILGRCHAHSLEEIKPYERYVYLVPYVINIVLR